MKDYWPDIKIFIDTTIERMVNKQFLEDPILGKSLSYAASIAGSTQKRHGLILEKAILYALKRYETSDYMVWEDPLFSVSPVADNMVHPADDPYTLLGSDVPYVPGKRTLQVDLITFDARSGQISAYEIKRGNAVHDAGKKRSILRDFVCTNLLIKDYGVQRGLSVKSSRCHIIFYYGALSLPKPHALSGDELDAHFGKKVSDFVDTANAYFRKSVLELIE